MLRRSELLRLDKQGLEKQGLEKQGLAKHIDMADLEQQWRALYPVAWADFLRFLQGWKPGHWKIHRYSKRMLEESVECIVLFCHRAAIVSFRNVSPSSRHRFVSSRHAASQIRFVCFSFLFFISGCTSKASRQRSGIVSFRHGR